MMNAADWVEHVSTLYDGRSAVLSSPGLLLSGLRGYDDRLDAGLDALAHAGGQERVELVSLAEEVGPGVSFPLVALACRTRNWKALFTICPPPVVRNELGTILQDALQWLDEETFRIAARDLGKVADETVRGVVTAASAARGSSHHVSNLIASSQDYVRHLGLLGVGTIGDVNSARACRESMTSDCADCRVSSVWSAVLLGDRGAALSHLADEAVSSRPTRPLAVTLSLQAMSLPDAHALLQRLARDPANLRLLIQGSGIVGDPNYVPWLINHMANPQLARLAGEAFTLITGVDLDAEQMWTARPEDVESGPTEEPDDENVDMDPDEGLPWPDVKKVEAWWARNGSRYQKGQRYFLGERVGRDHCLHVLKHGCQRQRILAAHYRCLLEPGTPLFNTSAPAWRQQRLLARMA